jgi:hypothetical protein
MGTGGNLGTGGALHRFIMSMLGLGPSESGKIISTAFRLTPYFLMIEVVTSARSTRGKPETEGPRFPSGGRKRRKRWGKRSGTVFLPGTVFLLRPTLLRAVARYRPR